MHKLKQKSDYSSSPPQKKPKKPLLKKKSIKRTYQESLIPISLWVA